LANEFAFVIADRFPVTPGHALVVTRREVGDWTEASGEERTAVLALVDETIRLLTERFHPDGFNVGFNVGEAAGQTIPHLHVHVIPRHTGDVPDPRGGVRHVIPGKGNYLASDGDGDPP
jgi:diadenosine tetraphosphate (Ap4A) HIT family hydrolase